MYPSTAQLIIQECFNTGAIISFPEAVVLSGLLHRNFNHDGNTKSFTSHNQWTTFLLLYLFVKGTPTTVESPVKGIGASWHADLQQRAPFAHVVSCQGEDLTENFLPVSSDASSLHVSHAGPRI